MILPNGMHNSRTFIPTASQTVGPFFSIGMCTHVLNNLVPADLLASSKVVTIRGRVLDGDGRGVPDAILEIWRADESENNAAKKSDCDDNGVPSGFARISTDEGGEFEFQVLKPGPITGNRGEIHAPHLAVLVFMRGLLRHLLTRIYFPDETANENDPVLTAVPPARRSTLVATQPAARKSELLWNVCLQGDAETVFFEA